METQTDYAARNIVEIDPDPNSGLNGDGMHVPSPAGTPWFQQPKAH
jgi:hypothetical protein